MMTCFWYFFAEVRCIREVQSIARTFHLRGGAEPAGVWCVRPAGTYTYRKKKEKKEKQGTILHNKVKRDENRVKGELML